MEEPMNAMGDSYIVAGTSGHKPKGIVRVLTIRGTWNTHWDDKYKDWHSVATRVNGKRGSAKVRFLTLCRESIFERGVRKRHLERVVTRQPRSGLTCCFE